MIYTFTMSGDYKKPETIYAIISAVNEVLSVSNEPQQLLEMVLDTLLEVLRIDCCWVQLLDSERHQLSLAAYRGFTPDMEREIGSLDLGWNFSNQVAGVGHKIVIPDLSRDRNHNLISFRKGAIRWLVAVPVRTYRVQGIMGIASRSRKLFNKEIADLLMVIASLFGVAIDKANLFQRTVNNGTKPDNNHLPIAATNNKNNTQRELVTELEQVAKQWISATSQAGEAAEQISKLSLPANADSPTPEKPAPTIARKTKDTSKIRVFIIDRDLLFLQGLALYLSQTGDIEVTGRSNGFTEEVAPLFADQVPDILLIDINLPSFEGLDLARRVNRYKPGLSIIMLTPYQDDNQVFETLKAGASGYISKNTTGDKIAHSIRRVYKGERIIHDFLLRPGIAHRVLEHFQNIAKDNHAEPISLQERIVLEYLAQGYSSKQLGQLLGTSDAEIVSHADSSITKLVNQGDAIDTLS